MGTNHSLYSWLDKGLCFRAGAVNRVAIVSRLGKRLEHRLDDVNAPSDAWSLPCLRLKHF